MANEVSQDHLLTELLAIKQNTSETTINAGDIELHVDGLESLIALTNDKLDHLSSNIDVVNTNLNPALGNIDGELEGQTVLLTTANTNTAHISDNLDHISSDLDHISTDLDAALVKQTSIDVHQAANRITLSSILAKNGEIETSANALIAANHTDLVALEASLTSMEGKIDVIDTVLDNSLTKQTNVESLITTLDGVQDSIFAQIYSQEQEIIALKTANHTDLVNTKDMVSSVGTTTNNNLAHISDNLDHLSSNQDTLEASLTSMEGKQDTMITALQILDNIVSGSEAQCDIVSSALPSGAATESTLASLLSSSQILSEDFTTCNTGAVVLAAGSAAIGKLAANSGVDIGDVDVTSLPLTFNSGNKGATTQRVVIATDDIPIALVNTKLDHLSDNLDTLESSLASMEGKQDSMVTALQILDNCISGNEAQVDIVSSALPSGAATESSLSAINGKVTACNTGAVVLAAGSAAIGKLGANSGVDIGDVDVTSISAGTNRIGMVGLKANEAADGSGTERHVLCDAAGNLQIDVVSTNLDLAHSATATNTAACAASLTLLDNAVDGNYINVNQNVAGADVAVNSGNKGTSVPRVCIATDDIPIALVNTKLDHLSDNLDTLESSLASMEGKQDSMVTALQILDNCISGSEAQVDIVSGTVTANLSATDNAVLDVVASKSTLATTSEVKEILSAATINSGNQSAQIDTENYEKVRFFGESTASVGTDIVLMGSNADGGTFYILGENLRSDTISGVHYVYGADIENLPRYIKLLNKSGSTNYIFTKLYMQGSGGRVAV